VDTTSFFRMKNGFQGKLIY